MLTADLQAEILVRHFRDGQSARRIAKDLGVDRKSVGQIVERRAVKEAAERRTRASLLDEFIPQIRALFEKDPKLPATVILQRLRQNGYSGGYTILKEWVAEHRPRSGRPKQAAFLTINFQVGECAQVDWGVFGDVFGNGGRIYCFVMVLCYSRRIYIEFTRSDKFEDFIRCHEHALEYFGGSPEEIWHDNLASAVSERHGPLIRFNARYFAYAGYHNFRPFPCNPGKGNEKGRVEDGVKYIRENFWPGRTFQDFSDLCEQARIWTCEIANRREHGATKRIPELVFAAEEKSKLKPLRPDRYDTDYIFTKEVPPNFFLTYQTNRYSVPWTLVGQPVTARVSDQFVRVFYHERLVACHERSYDKYKDIDKPEHKEGLLELKPGAKSQRSWQIETLKAMGAPLGEYLDFLGAGPRSLRYELSKLLALATVYGKDTLCQIVASFLKRGIIGVDQIELALKNSRHAAIKPAPLTFQREQLARVPPPVDLRRYDALLFHHAGAKDSTGNEEDTRDEATTTHHAPNEKPGRAGQEALGAQTEPLARSDDKGPAGP